MVSETRERGELVVSLAGHDKGKTFVIVELLNDGYALIADGQSRKLAAPKRKKIKHLKPLFSKIDLDGYGHSGGLNDGILRKEIKKNLNKIGG